MRLLVMVARAIAVATILSGLVQVVAPDLVLGLMSVSTSPAASHFFRIVGMFMMLFGGQCVHTLRQPDPSAFVPLLWCALQKLGASVAVTAGVVLSIMSPLALGVASFDLFSGVLLIALARRVLG
jgi:hypothetical protein